MFIKLFLTIKQYHRALFILGGLLLITALFYKFHLPVVKPIIILSALVTTAIVLKYNKLIRDKLLSFKCSNSMNPETQCLEKKIQDLLYKTIEKKSFIRTLLSPPSLTGVLLLGPKESGKSAFLNVMKFKEIEGRSFYDESNDVCATSACDLMIREKCVMFDFSGSYFTEGRQAHALKALLFKIKSFKRHIQICVIIIMVDIAPFLHNDIGAVHRLRNALVAQLDLCYSVYGYKMPCHIIFNKCDLIDGFLDFTCGSELKTIGMCCCNHRQTQTKLFKRQINAWISELFSLQLRTIHANRRSSMCYQLYHFPDHFHQILTKIADDLFDSVDVNTDHQPFIEGIFFTSNKSSNADIFDQHILPLTTAKLRGATGKHDHIVLLLSLAFLLTSAVLFNKSLSYQQVALTQAEVATSQFVEKFIGSLSVTKRQQALIDYVNHFRQIKEYLISTPHYLKFGFDHTGQIVISRNELIAVGVQSAYMPQLKKFLETKLNHYIKLWKSDHQRIKSQKAGDYYLTLKCYLMLGYPERINSEALSVLIANLWYQNGDALNKNNNSERKTVCSLFSIYCKQLKDGLHASPAMHAFKVNKRIVSQARRDLSSSITADIMFAELMIKMSVYHTPLGINDLLGKNSAEVYVSPETLPAMYTRVSWQSFVIKEIDELIKDNSQNNWVLNGELMRRNDVLSSESRRKVVSFMSDIKKDQLRKQMYTLYFKNYQHAWLQFIASITVKPFRSFEEAVEKLSELAKVNGPLENLLAVVIDNASICKHVDSALRTTCLNQMTVMSSLTGFRYHMRSYKEYLKGLDAFRYDIQPIMHNANIDLAAKEYLLPLMTRQALNTPLNKITQSIEPLINSIHFSQMHSVVAHLLLSPVRETFRVMVNRSLKQVERLWRDQVFLVYSRTIQQRYPFASFREQAEISRVNLFFQPQGGVLWQFVKNQLSSFLVLRDHEWKVKQWFGIQAPFSPEFLNALNHAQKITDILYASDAKRVNFSFQLFPIPTPGFSQIVFQINNHFYHYSNGPQLWRRFTWTGDAIDDQVMLTATASHGDNMQSLTFYGAWGLFHLFDCAQKKYLGQGAYQLTWKLSNAKGRQSKIRFLLQIQGVSDFFELHLWRGLKLPAHL